jgi:EAL domain-containing protein (putative c-di-GMP-specific phosphodiesterase class I)
VPKSRKLIAIAVGTLLSTAPILALDFYIDSLILRQNTSEAETFARRSMLLAEERLGVTLAALDTLAQRGVDDCRADQVDALKAANLTIPWVKQMAVLGAAGQPLCTDLSPPNGAQQVLSSQPIKDSDTTLEVVQSGEPPLRLVRLRRPVGLGPNSLAALLPVEVLVARFGIGPDRRATYFQLSLLDGTIVDTAGRPPPDSDTVAAMESNARLSNRFGLRFTTSRRQAESTNALGGLHEIVTAITAGFALVLLAFAVILRRRSDDNPVAELVRALHSAEFIPYYQPTVDITNGRLRGVEVLMRWKKRDGSIIPPAAFIPLAESSGLIVEMTHSMMRHVIADLGDACAARPKLQVGFNMTAQHFANERIVRDLRTIFEKSPIRYSQIVLEVTERQPLENLNNTRRVIAALQDLGVRVAIDDVGTGHGGLSYILKLGADIIKIDKMFIDALGSDNHSTTIIETLVDLAGSMRMDVIAEGVETFEQVAALRERGVRTAQGYVFAPPLPARSFLQLLEAIDPRPARVAVDRTAGPLRGLSGRRKRAA